MPKVTITGFGDVNFPDTMTPDQIQSAIESDILPKMNQPAQQPSPPVRFMEPPSMVDKALSHLPSLPGWLAERGGVAGRVAMGMADPGVGLAQMAMHAIGQGDTADKRIQQVEQQYQTSRQGEGSSGFDPLRLAGNVGVSMMVPGVVSEAPTSMLAQLLRGAGTGAAYNVAQPVTQPGNYWGEKGTQAALGGVMGAAAVPVAAGLARMVKPQTGEAANTLMDAGVTLTPGDILGGGFKRAEDAATSWPVIGDVIRDAKNRTLVDMNRATYARALEPIGQGDLAKSLPAGPEGVLAVKNALGQAYDDLLPKLKFDVKTVTPQLAQLRQMAAGLPDQEAAQFNKILDKNLGQLSNGLADGQTFKQIVSNLGLEAKNFQGAADGYQRQLGAALGEVQNVFRQGLKASNPEFAEQLANIDKGYANYARIRAAAASAGDKSSGFTPSQLAAAVRSQDKSVGKGAKATGQALMQDLSDAATAVLPSSVADSGTPFRHAIQLAAGGLVGHSVLPEAAAGMMLPAAVGGGLMTLPYTKVGQKLAQTVLAERPEYAATLAQLLRSGAPLVGAATVPAITQGS